MPLTVANASITTGRTIGGEPRDLIHLPNLVQKIQEKLTKGNFTQFNL